MTKVLIGIQARSTSERLPNKALINLYNKPILSWVINACLDSKKYLNANHKHIMDVDVAILCPIGDEISRLYKNNYLIEGSESDVLSRYINAREVFDSDYICRITGDCPFLTGFLITNHILKAVDHNFDYISNVDPKYRTELDGRDVEVLSRKALNWLKDNALSQSEKEHVTIKINQDKPKCLKRGHILNRIDISDIKLSIDTPKDLANAKSRVSSFFKKRLEAEQDVGNKNIFLV